jgi:8-oxo-dGTP diphosphatase
MPQQDAIDVVAGLLFKEGRVLACQRRADGPFALKWEFPGGKIEPGEGAATALVRELREELGINSQEVNEVFAHTHSYPGSVTVKLRFFEVPRYCGEVINRVFNRICWVAPAELSKLDFLDGDRPIIEWLMSTHAIALWHGRSL